MQPRFKVLNWNIGGAKYLQLRSEDSSQREDPTKPLRDGEQTREAFRKSLNRALANLIRSEDPAIITLQELVKYSRTDSEADAEAVIDVPEGYTLSPLWLIDTDHHSHQGKWIKVRSMGEWPEEALFFQGNATLVKKTLPQFNIFSLPTLSDCADAAKKAQSLVVREEGPTAVVGKELSEVIKLESGIYFGDRNTEPRAALVSHVVLHEVSGIVGHEEKVVSMSKPLDIFVVNLHLTTLSLEREGVPHIDTQGSNRRLRQLDIVLNGIVSRYNQWCKEEYPIRNIKPRERWADEEQDRHPPIWIISGDFNFTPESVEYETMIRHGFVDLLPHHNVHSKAKGLGHDPTITVDYIFAGPLFEAIDPRVIPDIIEQNRVIVPERASERVSDHFPVSARLPISPMG